MGLLSGVEHVVHKAVHRASREATKAEQGVANDATNATKAVTHLVNEVGSDGKKAVAEIKLLSDGARRQCQAYGAKFLSPCNVAVGILAIDVGFFLYGLVGLVPPDEDSESILGKAMLDAMDDKTGLNWAERNIQQVRDITEAETTIQKAKALFTFAGSVNKVGMFSKWPAIFSGRMSDEEWAITGVQAVGTLTLWFGSDGAAAVAKVAMEAASFGQVVLDAQAARQACNC